MTPETKLKALRELLALAQENRMDALQWPWGRASEELASADKLISDIQADIDRLTGTTTTPIGPVIGPVIEA